MKQNKKGRIQFEIGFIFGKADGINCQRKNGDKIQGANPLFAAKLKTPMLIQKDFTLVAMAVNGLRKQLLLCYLTKSEGGTAYTAAYAAEKGLRVIDIAK